MFDRGKIIYSLSFISFILIGATCSDVLLICVTDYVLLLLTAICVAALIKRSDRILYLSERAGLVIPHRRS